MTLYRWDRIAEEQLNASLARRVIHGSELTAARIRLAAGATVPAHSHSNEQLTMLLEGSLRVTGGGVERVLRAGDMLLIPPHAEHAVEALEDSVAVDIFAPRREDWIRGDDAYLRR